MNKMWYVHAAAKSLQSCPTLCDPIDGSPSGSPVPGILQARTLEWVAISFSDAWKWKMKGKLLSCVRLFTTPWNAAHQAPPSMGFSRQEYWSGVPSPSPVCTYIGLLLSLENEILMYAQTLTYLENIMLHEKRQTKKGKYCMIPFIWITKNRQMPKQKIEVYQRLNWVKINYFLKNRVSVWNNDKFLEMGGNDSCTTI